MTSYKLIHMRSFHNSSTLKKVKVFELGGANIILAPERPTLENCESEARPGHRVSVRPAWAT